MQETLDHADARRDDGDDAEAEARDHDAGRAPTLVQDPVGFSRSVLLAVVAAGIVLRLGILLSPIGRADADEVISGLMARHLADDGFRTFFWGQHYGGTIEVYPVWLSTRLFGESTLAMRLPTLILGAVNALLLWRIARRVLPERQAQLAAVLLWLGPPTFLWFSVREQLFYPPTVTMGLVIGVFAFRIRERGRVVDYAVLGLTAGVGWWTTPSIVYFLIPAAVVLVDRPKLWRRWKELLVGVPVAAVAAVAGAWPWIYDCLTNDNAPLKANKLFPVLGTYWSRFGSFFTDGLPGVLGFRETFTYKWILGPVAMVAFLLVAGILVFGLAKAAWTRSWEAVGLVAFPFVYAKIEWVTDDVNLRYLFYVVPFVAVVLARVLTSRRAATLAVVATLLITGVGMQRLYAVSEIDRTFTIGGVRDLDPVVATLDELHVDRVYGDYWVAYRLDWETHERIIATPSWGIPRYDPYLDTVHASARPAWVLSGANQEAEFTQAAQDKGFTFERHQAGEYVVAITSRHVRPEELPQGARHPLFSGS